MSNSAFNRKSEHLFFLQFLLQLSHLCLATYVKIAHFLYWFISLFERLKSLTAQWTCANQDELSYCLSWILAPQRFVGLKPSTADSLASWTPLWFTATAAPDTPQQPNPRALLLFHFTSFATVRETIKDNLVFFCSFSFLFMPHRLRLKTPDWLLNMGAWLCLSEWLVWQKPGSSVINLYARIKDILESWASCTALVSYSALGCCWSPLWWPEGQRVRGCAPSLPLFVWTGELILCSCQAQLAGFSSYAMKGWASLPVCFSDLP